MYMENIVMNEKSLPRGKTRSKRVANINHFWCLKIHSGALSLRRIKQLISELQVCFIPPSLGAKCENNVIHRNCMVNFPEVNLQAFFSHPPWSKHRDKYTSTCNDTETWMEEFGLTKYLTSSLQLLYPKLSWSSSSSSLWTPSSSSSSSAAAAAA